MQMRFLSKSSKIHTTAPQLAAFENPNMAHDARRLSPPGKPNIALVGILIGCPVMVIAFIALLSAGHPFLEALLVAYTLQVLAFCVVVVVGLAGAKNPEHGMPTPNDTDYPPREAADIWRTYPSSVEAERSVRIALIAADIKQSRMIATDLARLGVDVHHSTDRDALLETVQARPQDWGAVIFDLDSGPDVDAGVDEVLDFRSVCPDIPVLLLSDAALHTDLSPRLQSIGGMSLQKPVLRQHLVAGLGAMNLTFVAGHQDDWDVPVRSLTAMNTT